MVDIGSDGIHFWSLGSICIRIIEVKVLAKSKDIICLIVEVWHPFSRAKMERLINNSAK